MDQGSKQQPTGCDDCSNNSGVHGVQARGKTKACWAQPVKQSAPVGEPVEMLFCEYMHTFMREPEFEAVG